jgi:hypothetical protein
MLWIENRSQSIEVISILRKSLVQKMVLSLNSWESEVRGLAAGEFGNWVWLI